MSEETAPTVAELETKANRLTAQVDADTKAVAGSGAAVERAMKSNDLAQVLEAADARTTAQKALDKSTSQLKTAKNAVTFAKRAANAGKVADLNEKRRNTFAVLPRVAEGTVTVPCTGPALAVIEAIAKLTPVLADYAALGVTALKISVSEESGKTIIEAVDPTAKRTRASGSNRGTASWNVGGQTFTSRELVEANLDMLTDTVQEHYASGDFAAFSMTREAEKIHAKLTG